MKKLICKSDIIHVKISEYTPITYKFNNWAISDEYTEPANKELEYGAYMIVIESEEVENKAQLDSLSFEAHELLYLLSKFVKYATSINFNHPVNHINSCSKILKMPKDFPRGWNSNYEEIRKHIESQYSKGIRLEITFSTSPQVLIPTAPLNDIHDMLCKYNGIDAIIKDLMELHFKAMECDNHIRYLILGKVLEIIDSLYPLSASRNRTDTRIKEKFAELLPVFGDITIKQLMNWANNRKESRHYFIKGTNNTSHGSFTHEELIRYYNCIDLLAFSVIRKGFEMKSVCIRSTSENN